MYHKLKPYECHKTGAISLVFCGSQADNHQKDKAEKKRLHTEKRCAIKEFCVNSGRQLLHIAQKKRDITKTQPFVYDVSDYIERIYTSRSHNGYKKTFPRVKKEVFGIFRADVPWLLEHCQVYMVNTQNTT